MLVLERLIGSGPESTPDSYILQREMVPAHHTLHVKYKDIYKFLKVLYLKLRAKQNGEIGGSRIVAPGSVVSEKDFKITNSIYSVHNTLNLCTLGAGRRKEHMISPRVLVVDLDFGTTKENALYLAAQENASLVVESRPGRFHIYWQISENVSLDSWSKFQLALAHKLGGDTNLRNITSMLRVPGFQRFLPDGSVYTPNIIFKEKSPDVYSLDDMYSVWPDVDELYQSGLDELRAVYDEQKKAAQQVFAEIQKSGASGVKADGIPGLPTSSSFTSTVHKYGRNQALYSILKLTGYKAYRDTYQFKKPDDFIRLLAAQAQLINEKFQESLEEREVLEIVSKLSVKVPKMYQAEVEQEKQAVDEAAKLLVRRDVEDTKIGKDVTTTLPMAPVAVTVTSVSSNQPGEIQPGEKQASQPRVEPSDPDIPDNLLDLAVQFAEYIYNKHNEQLSKIFKVAFKSKNYIPLCDLIFRYYHLLGKIKASGASVSLAGQSKWGESIYEVRSLNRDEFSGLVSRIAFKWASLFLSDKRTKIIDKMPKSSEFKAIADISHTVLVTLPVVKRQHPMFIVYQNGVLNVALREFTPDKLAALKHSNPIHARFIPEVLNVAREHRDVPASELVRILCPVTYRYMNDWFPGDPATIDLLLRFIGYSMTTNTTKQKFLFFFGPGGSGKGSIVQMIEAILGQSNCAGVEYKGLDSPYKVSEFVDKLLISIDEVEGTKKEHERRLSLVKQITGGGMMQIERKYAHPYNDHITGKLVLQSNELLEYQDKGGSITGRMIPVGFEQRFRGSSVAEQLEKEPITGMIEARSEFRLSKSTKSKQSQLVEGVERPEDAKDAGYSLIIEHELNILATLAGLSWMKSLRQNAGLTLPLMGSDEFAKVGKLSAEARQARLKAKPQSAALGVGVNKMKGTLNPIEYALLAFTEYSRGMTCRNKDLVALCYLVGILGNDDWSGTTNRAKLDNLFGEHNSGSSNQRRLKQLFEYEFKYLYRGEMSISYQRVRGIKGSENAEGRERVWGNVWINFTKLYSQFKELEGLRMADGTLNLEVADDLMDDAIEWMGEFEEAACTCLGVEWNGKSKEFVDKCRKRYLSSTDNNISQYSDMLKR